MKLIKWFATSGIAVLSILAVTTTDVSAKDATPQVIEIHSKKFSYEPAEITLHKGVTYKLHVTSDDVPHSLRIKDLNLNAKVAPAEFNDIPVTPYQAGDFNPHGGLYRGSGHTTNAIAVHV